MKTILIIITSYGISKFQATYYIIYYLFIYRNYVLLRITFRITLKSDT